MTIQNTLKERQKRYGSFKETSRVAQNIKEAMRDSRNWAYLDASKKEALEMFAYKIGRILNGDPNWHDSWHDLVGYAHLVADELEPLLSSSDSKARSVTYEG